MDKLHSIANRAKLRIQLNLTIHHLIQWMMYIAGFALLLAMVDRLGVNSFLPWTTVWILFGAFILGVILTQWSAQALSEVEAACEVDQRMELHDRLSSAITCTSDQNPFCAALITDAIEIVDSRRVQFNLPRHFPISIPKNFSWVIAIALTTTFVLWTGQWGFWNDKKDDSLPAGLIASPENIEASVDSVLEQLKEDEVLSESLEQELEALEALNANASVDPETLRRDALRKLTDLQKKLDELMQNEDTLTLEDMLRRMQALELPKNSKTLPLVAAMKNGDFDKAKKEFEQLQQQMESEELSEEEREQLEKQLEELAKQLEQLASANEALASAMSAAGMNGALAGNSEAALKAIKNAKNLNAEQKKKLLELLKSQKKAGKMCKKMASACKSGSKGMGAMASELEQLEAMQMFKTKAQMAKSACQKASQGMCKNGGGGSGQGQGTGGKGKGNGGKNPFEETQTAYVAEQAPVNSIEGTIIARQLFEGGLLTSGESNAAVRDTVLAESRNAEQAITDEEVPRRYHDLLRHYFGQLEKLTKSSGDGDAQVNE